MAVSPNFAATPRISIGQLSAANTNRDGTGTIVQVLLGSTAGTRISEVIVHATATTTAGMVRLFIHDGTNARLFDEIPIPAVTVSASVAGARVSRVYENLVLPGNVWSLRAATHNAEAFNVVALGADL